MSLFSNLVSHVKSYSEIADFDKFEMDLVLSYAHTLSKDELKQLVLICEAHIV